MIVEKGLRQESLGQMIPADVTQVILGASPSKGKACLQDRQVRTRRAQDLKRMESGTWDSSGVISADWLWALLLFVMAYFLVSRPRHSASRTAEVPGIGAQRRSMGGKICFRRYQSVSGLRVEVGVVTSAGA